jgi:hypothetical protein
LKAGAALQVRMPGNKASVSRVQKTLRELLRVDRKILGLPAKDDRSKPFKDLVSNSSWPADNATIRCSASMHNVVKKCRVRMRSAAPGMVAAPVLIVTAEAAVLRVPKNRRGKAPHSAADNAHRVEAGERAEAVGVAEEVVVVVGDRICG